MGIITQTMNILEVYVTLSYMLMIGMIFFFGYEVIDRKRKLSWLGITVTAILWPVLVAIIMVDHKRWNKMIGSTITKRESKDNATENTRDTE